MDKRVQKAYDRIGELMHIAFDTESEELKDWALIGMEIKKLKRQSLVIRELSSAANHAAAIINGEIIDQCQSGGVCITCDLASRAVEQVNDATMKADNYLSGDKK
jgi:hypothetical protein